MYTVIRFVSTNAKFGICTVVGLIGALVETTVKYALGLLDEHISASTSVLYRLTTVQMPNLALIETKWITEYINELYRAPQEEQTLGKRNQRKRRVDVLQGSYYCPY